MIVVARVSVEAAWSWGFQCPKKGIKCPDECAAAKSEQQIGSLSLSETSTSPHRPSPHSLAVVSSSVCLLTDKEGERTQFLGLSFDGQGELVSVSTDKNIGFRFCRCSDSLPPQTFGVVVQLQFLPPRTLGVLMPYEEFAEEDDADVF